MPNYKRLFGEAVADSVRDYAQQNNLVQPGFWAVRLRKGGPEVPAKVWICDHEPGEPGNKLDTGPILMAEINGEPADPLNVWVARERREISEQEYRYLVADIEWCRQYKKDDPRLTPLRAIDLKSAPLPFAKDESNE